MRPWKSVFALLGLGVLAVTGACGSRTTAKETPLAVLSAERAPAAADVSDGGPIIVGAAKVALYSGNALYRAKSYRAALVQYERCATLEPRSPSPVFGIYMVASITNDTALARVTMARLKAIGAALGDSTGSLADPTALKAHATRK